MIATTKEQSERILKCGIPADSADMTIHDFVTGLTSLLAEDYKNFRESACPECFTPAWSLGKLISFLPRELDGFECHYQYDFFSDDCPEIVEGHYTLEGELIILHSDTWIVDYDLEGFVGHLPQSKDPIEAVIQAIELLHENGYRFNNVKTSE